MIAGTPRPTIAAYAEPRLQGSLPPRRLAGAPPRRSPALLLALADATRRLAERLAGVGDNLRSETRVWALARLHARANSSCQRVLHAVWIP